MCLLSTAHVSMGRRVQGQKISWWEGQKGLAFLQDVQLVDGELVVPQPGLYYVYAQTYFRHTHSLEEEGEEGEEGEEVEDRGRPLLQYVYKKVISTLSCVVISILKTTLHGPSFEMCLLFLITSPFESLYPSPSERDKECFSATQHGDTPANLFLIW